MQYVCFVYIHTDIQVLIFLVGGLDWWKDGTVGSVTVFLTDYLKCKKEKKNYRLIFGGSIIYLSAYVV